MYEWIERVFDVVVRYGIIVMECIGVALILLAAFRTVVRMIRKSSPHPSLELAQGIALALEFLLCGEIMHTLVVRDTDELILVGVIVIMRIALTVLIHWEAKHEKDEISKDASGGQNH